MQWDKDLFGSKSCRWNRMDLLCTVLCLSSFAISLIVVFTVTPAPKICDSVTLVSRDVWGARGIEPQRALSGPVNVVFVHHTGTKGCNTNPTCKHEMKSIQSNHMDAMGMSDIGYSFVVGENGWVYEGRGWGKPTEHIEQWDGQSVSIAIMGDFNTTEPNKWAMGAVRTVLKCGVESGHFSEEYKLLVRQDEDSPINAGPGKMLYDKLKDWDHYATNENGQERVNIVSRVEWGARETLLSNPMEVPVALVFIHHTAMSDSLTLKDYKADMRTIQDFHMDTRGWDDIGYNFLVGEDGLVYEGRGWRRVGAHTKGWNDVSLAVSVIGDYSAKLPAKAALTAVKDWIEMGVKLGHIKPDYKLYGHRDTNPATVSW